MTSPTQPLPKTPLTSLKTPTSTPLPQIICLHGRGSNARILQFQTRLITSKLGHIFEFLFIDGPFESNAGPGILPWFEGMDPYFHWGSAKIGFSSDSALMGGSEVGEKEEEREMRVLNGVLDGVLRGEGASRVVGVLGFSQGTRVASGLLKYQEILMGLEGEEKVKSSLTAQSSLENQRANLNFGILVCGGGGLSFRPFNLIPSETMPFKDSLELLTLKKVDGEVEKAEYDEEKKIRIPTVHVHGKTDAIADKGKEMVEAWFDEESARVLEVDAGHHFPREKEDVENVCRNILEMWELSKEGWEAAHLN